MNLDERYLEVESQALILILPFGRYGQKCPICYVDSAGASHLVTDCKGMLNGITISKDNNTLFVASGFKNQILAYNIESPGK